MYFFKELLEEIRSPKTFFSWVFRQPEDRSKPRPVFIFVLMISAIGCMLYYGASTLSTLPIQEKLEELKSSLISDDKEAPKEEAVEMLEIPDVPSNVRNVDDLLQDEKEEPEKEELPFVSIDLSDTGKRDPMRPSEGTEMGQMNQKNATVYDWNTGDGSKGYFKGMMVENISLDKVFIDLKDDKVKANFKAYGAKFNNLTEGDYLNEIYHILAINYTYKYVTIQYQDKVYQVFKDPAQNRLISKNAKYESSRIENLKETDAPENGGATTEPAPVTSTDNSSWNVSQQYTKVTTCDEFKKLTDKSKVAYTAALDKDNDGLMCDE